MKHLLIALMLFALPTFAGDKKISELPLATASSTGTNDVLPFYSISGANTYKVKLSDLLNLPSMQSQFLGMIPSQTGNNGKFLSTNGSVTSWVNGGTSAPSKFIFSNTTSIPGYAINNVPGLLVDSDLAGVGLLGTSDVTSGSAARLYIATGWSSDPVGFGGDLDIYTGCGPAENRCGDTTLLARNIHLQSISNSGGYVFIEPDFYDSTNNKFKLGYNNGYYTPALGDVISTSGSDGSGIFMAVAPAGLPSAFDQGVYTTTHGVLTANKRIRLSTTDTVGGDAAGILLNTTNWTTLEPFIDGLKIDPNNRVVFGTADITGTTYTHTAAATIGSQCIDLTFAGADREQIPLGAYVYDNTTPGNISAGTYVDGISSDGCGGNNPVHLSQAVTATFTVDSLSFKGGRTADTYITTGTVTDAGASAPDSFAGDIYIKPGGSPGTEGSVILKTKGSIGTAGQVLESTGSATEWKDKSSPSGTLCGWNDGTLALNCQGSDPAVSCPTGYTQRTTATGAQTCSAD